MRQRSPRTTLFPYTTLFRSHFGLNFDVLLNRLRTQFGKHARRFGDTNHNVREDRKSTRLNSSHVENSYAVFCLKKKNRLKLTILIEKEYVWSNVQSPRLKS